MKHPVCVSVSKVYLQLSNVHVGEQMSRDAAAVGGERRVRFLHAPAQHLSHGGHGAAAALALTDKSCM